MNELLCREGRVGKQSWLWGALSLASNSTPLAGHRNLSNIFFPKIVAYSLAWGDLGTGVYQFCRFSMDSIQTVDGWEFSGVPKNNKITSHHWKSGVSRRWRWATWICVY
jgi:hypothetical protein